MEQSAFRGTLEFFNRLGLYDVMLPFLLVFTMVFAMLEKTKVYGTEKLSDGKEVTRKNLNAMTAFVIAFFVVASSKLVAAITAISSYAVLLALGVVLFMMLVGTFWKPDDKGFYLEGWMKWVFVGIMFFGLVAIFLSVLTDADGTSWLQLTLNFLGDIWTNTLSATIFMVIIIVVAMVYATHGQKASSAAEKKS